MIIKERIKQISSRITEVCNRIGTDPATIKLLAVTKNHPVQAIEEVLEAGLLTIAENKVQESLQKIPGLKGKFEEFHFIGHLQSNKLRKVLGLKPFLIHSIDSVSTLSKMERILAETNQNQQILIQVNTSQETSKSGIEPSQLESFIKDCAAFSHITICGLMTIGKLTNDESEIRECFKLEVSGD